MSMTGALSPLLLASRTIPRVDSIVTPFCRAIYDGSDEGLRPVAWLGRLTVFEVWMVGPSAMGSVKGAPSSITSAPPFSMAKRMPGVSSGLGYPAVT
jgi:hypothetical protein